MTEPDIIVADFDKLETADHTQNIFQSCCGGTSDKRLIVIITQILFSAIILCFACAMMIRNIDDTGIYLSLITSVLSYWLGKNEMIK
jgi:hypothetical protein